MSTPRPGPGTPITRSLWAQSPPPTVPGSRRPPERTTADRTSADRARPLPEPGWRFPHVLAHRGASGYRPEHTLAGYELAARLCADYLTVDLVNTADGVLVARHGPEISRSTDVADHPEFADRRTTRWITGHPVHGWFVDDFAVEEIKSLRARERLPLLRPENTAFDDRFEIPTLDEVFDLRARLSATLGWDLGLYLKVRHPSYHAALGFAPEPVLLTALDRAGLNHPQAPVFVAAGHAGMLRGLRGQGLCAPAVHLLAGSGDPGPGPATTGGPRPRHPSPADLDLVAEYAQAIGPGRDQVVTQAADGRSRQPTSLVRDAHDAGLLVYPRTFRAERAYLPQAFRHRESTGIDFPGATAELAEHLAAGVDGVLVDHPDVAVLARQLVRRSPHRPD